MVSIRVARTFCTQHSRFLSLQYLNRYLSRFKCKNFWGFRATRTHDTRATFVLLNNRIVVDVYDSVTLLNSNVWFHRR